MWAISEAHMVTTRPLEKLGYTVAQTLETGAFPTKQKLYAAIARGDIDTWKDGRSRMISAVSLRRYVERVAST
jgi:hypothetical protein